MRKFLITLMAALGLVLAVPAVASAHEDYSAGAPGDHYGHYPTTTDNFNVPHLGTSPYWNGAAFGNPNTYGYAKYGGMRIFDGSGEGCGAGHLVEVNVVRYIKDVLAAETGHGLVYNDGGGCFGIYTKAAVQDLEAFFGYTVDGIVDATTMNALDFLASNG